MSKRQADDSLQLNDRLKEKLEHVMEEHVSEMSNMTCVLREMNVLNSRNNIDIAAMKADTKKKIEANFGPVEELLQSFNNQINEEQLFFMVNEILQGSDEEYWW